VQSFLKGQSAGKKVCYARDVNKKGSLEMDESTKYFYEMCLTVRDRCGKMLELQELSKYTGFRSVYGFSENAATLIKAQGHSRGFARFKLYADIMFVDFDDQPEEAEKLKQSLLDFGVAFEVWDSGNRSFHFHIPHTPKFSKDLPYTHKQVLKALGVDLTKVDITLYRPNSIFRLPRTRHQKTGNPKVLLDKIEGDILDFSIKEEPIKEYAKGGEDIHGNPLEYFLTQALKVYLEGAETGNRHGSMFNVACCAFELGLDEEAAIVICSHLNNNFSTPKPESEVKRAVKGGFDFMKGV
jgi:hypothetical protein